MQLPPLMLPQNQPGLERVGGCLIGFGSLIWHIFSSFILYCVKAFFYENITFGEPHDTYEMLWSNVACKKRSSHRNPVHIPSKDCHAISTWIVFQEKFHLDARKKPVTLPLLLLLAASRPVTCFEKKFDAITLPIGSGWSLQMCILPWSKGSRVW